MKHKTYGDNNNEYEFGSGIEIISNDDPISARSVNRPIANLYENEEETYKLLNTVMKTIYGNVNNAILPDIYEDFTPEGFVINSFKNDSSKFFLRIPTGMMIINNHKDNPQKNKGNPFSIPGEHDYIEEVNKNNFTKDIDSSFVFDNRPNISLWERQLSNFIALDLNDLTNDINIHEIEVPMTYNVSVVDPVNKFQLLDADGNLSYVTDNSGNQLFICEENKAEYYLAGVKISYMDLEYNYKPCGEHKDKLENFVHEKLKQYYIEKKPNEDIEKSLVKVGGEKPSEDFVYLTSDYLEAIPVKDYNGNNKTRLGYYMDVVRATEQDDEEVHLPNKKENASWKICLPAGGNPLHHNREHKYTYIIRITDKEGKPVGKEKYEFFFYDYMSEDDINNTLFNKVLLEGNETFNLSKFQFGKEVIHHGVNISMISNSKNCNDYRLKIEYYEGDDIDNIKTCETLYTKTEYPENKIDNVLPTPSHRQKCYNNIFELTNAFLGKFSSYQIGITNIYNYLSGETILYLPDGGNKFSLYYDLNANYLDNKNNIYYDKSGKILLSSSSKLEKENANLIKLFDLEINRSGSIGNAPKIKKIKVYPITLDKRNINTKLAEYDTLISNSRTELNNYVVMGDEGRKIEIAEDAPSNDKQTRITSPVLRLSTKNVLSSNNPSWTENGGDEESDFRDSYESRNFITNDVTTNYHNDSDMGIILNDNKGIKIYSNDSKETTGSHSDISSFKPIEISNSKGNINLLTKDDNSRINIKNINDKETNIIDLLGVTRVRSSNETPLVVRRIDNRPYKDNISNTYVSFINGYSKSEENLGALNNKIDHEDDDIMIGRINFYHGTDSSTSTNKTINNRMVSFELADHNSIGNKEGEQKKLFTGRGAKSAEKDKEGGKKVFTLFGDVAPSNETYSLGFPKASRSYSELNDVIPYSKEDGRAELNVNSNGTSTEFLNEEGRWLSSFIKYGYFDKVTLSDTEIKNEDKRNGALRLGNSNIYDVSSIYINYDSNNAINRKNEGTINFDNKCKKIEDPKSVYENTIFSYSEENLGKSSINFIINRRLETKPSYNTVNDGIHEDGLNMVNITNSGTTFAKDVSINRQLFVNCRKNGTDKNKDATQFDNNSLVVNGQSILNGELILGLDLKNKANVDIKNYSTNSGYSTYEELDNLKNPNKLYNEEYGKKGDIKYLYTLRNYGRTYLNGDVTLKGNFTENSIFDKKIVINNNAYKNIKYDDINKIDSSDITYYSTVKDDFDYVPEETTNTSTRHHTSLEVESGRVKIGQTPDSTEKDTSDLEVNGSQWIRRRLEVGNKSGPNLIDSYIFNEQQKVSPTLYVDGGTNFNGDVTFGGGLTKIKHNDKYDSFIMRNKRIAEEDTEETIESFKEVKVIFWGSHDIDVDDITDINKSIATTDFDFHGSTWFDNAVRIGGDDGLKSSRHKDGRLVVKGKSSDFPSSGGIDKWRTDLSTAYIEGTLSVFGDGYNEIKGKSINIYTKDIYDAPEQSKSKDSAIYIDKDNVNISVSNEFGSTKKSTGISISNLAYDKNQVPIESNIGIISQGDTNVESKLGNIKLLSKKNFTVDSESGASITSNLNLSVSSKASNVLISAGKNIAISGKNIGILNDSISIYHETGKGDAKVNDRYIEMDSAGIRSASSEKISMKLIGSNKLDPRTEILEIAKNNISIIARDNESGIKLSYISDSDSSQKEGRVTIIGKTNIKDKTSIDGDTDINGNLKVNSLKSRDGKDVYSKIVLNNTTSFNTVIEELIVTDEKGVETKVINHILDIKFL